MHGIAIIDHQLGGLRTDIHHRNSFAPVLRQNRGVTRGERLVHRFLHREMRRVDGADDGVVLLHRGRHQVDVDFQARCQHLSRIAVAGMLIHHEILREELQHHPVFHQLHA